MMTPFSKSRILTGLIAMALLCVSGVRAEAASGASFLKIGVGARAVGLASAYTALADDVTALHWNPAGLSRLGSKQLAATHAELYADTRYDFFGYAHPTAKGTFGVSAVDVFYVKDQFGLKIDKEARLAQIRE